MLSKSPSWSLLADICAASDPKASLSCYCKALLCSQDEQFIGKVRLALAECLIQAGDYSRAKHEVEQVVAARHKESQRVPEAATRIAGLPWYEGTLAASSNTEFYRANSQAAEALLYSSMPWMDACIGETFSTQNADGKPRTWRKLFVQRPGMPIEARMPESRFADKHLQVGAAIRIKGEFDDRSHLQIALLEERSAGWLWDVFPEQIAVVDGINVDKGVVHYIVSRDMDGLIPLAELPMPVAVGDSLSLRISQYDSKQGKRYRVLAAQATPQVPSASVRKDFASVVRADSEMGFTDDDVFIPPPLMRAGAVQDGDRVDGVAILNYNRKRGSWGWKAISAEVRQRSHPAQDQAA